MDSEEIIIHSDGGARGNPGPGACAFIIESGGKIVGKGSKYLGIVTNNFAEYSGVLLSLQWLEGSVLPKDQQIKFYLDSELVVKQLGGSYKIKNQNLLKLNAEIKDIIQKNSLRINFIHILRSKNKIADLLVNNELDRNK